MLYSGYIKKEVTVGFLIDKDKILLANIEFSDGKKLWTGIGGYINVGESPEEAVIREFAEETFIEIKSQDVEKVRVLDEADKVFVFKVTKWSGELNIKDQNIKELRWFEKDNLPCANMYAGNDQWIPELFK